MAEPEPAGEVTDGASQRFLTFRMADRLYALPADEVTEVIRTPAVARVPQGPDSLLGVANLRGEVLPVASLRGLLGQAAMGVTASSRALVLSGAAPVALVVDAVDALVTVGRDQIETTQTLLAAQPGERLTGAFRRGDGKAVAKVLDIRSLLADAFVQRARPARVQRTLASAARSSASVSRRCGRSSPLPGPWRWFRTARRWCSASRPIATPCCRCFRCAASWACRKPPGLHSTRWW